jgi:hypothetical protein
MFLSNLRTAYFFCKSGSMGIFNSLIDYRLEICVRDFICVTKLLFCMKKECKFVVGVAMIHLLL